MVGRDLDPPARWVRTNWNEPDLIGTPAPGLDGSRMVFLYEFSAGGLPLRIIELMGEDLVPVGAASIAEFWEAQEYQHQASTPALIALRERFGEVPEGTEADWGDYPREEITQGEFERSWGTSRAHLLERPRSDHFAP